MFGPFGLTKGWAHKHELTRFYPKLKLRKALLKFMTVAYLLSLTSKLPNWP